MRTSVIKIILLPLILYSNIAFGDGGTIPVKEASIESFQKAGELANSICQSRGFSNAEIEEPINNNALQRIEVPYSCYSLAHTSTPSYLNYQLIKPNDQQVLTTSNLANAKVKCTELGFKSGTEDFGKCVLQLSK